MRFTVTVQDPFEQQAQTNALLSGDEAWQRFEQVDWEQLEKAVYDRLDEVVHHFYFYEISEDAYGDKRTLNISPGFVRNGDMPTKRRLYMVRYEYPHPTQPGRYLDYSYPQSDDAFAQESVKAFIQGNRQFFTSRFEMPANKGLVRSRLFKKLFRLALILLAALLLFVQFVVGWSHVPEHWASLKMWLFPGSFENAAADEAEPAVAMATGAAAGITDSAKPAPAVLLDTVRWKAAIERGDFIPEGVKEDYERARRFDYTRLQPATEQPTSQEAEHAILHYYKEEARKLLKEHNAHIRIGKAYTAPLQPDGTNGGEIARVTAMVCALNRRGRTLATFRCR